MGDRRRAALLAAMLVVLIPLGLLSGVVQLLVIPEFARTFVPILGALGLLSIAYVASRTRHYQIGGLIASIAPVVASAASGLRRPSDSVWWAFVELGVLFATIFLTTTWAVIVAIVAFASVLFVYLVAPALTERGGMLPPLAFHAVFSPLIIIAAAHRNRIEEERRRVTRALDEARRLESVGRLAGGIAHDFNNLLQAITSNAALLRDVVPEEDACNLDEIFAAAGRAGLLTKQLLAYARRQELAPSRIELGRVVAQMDTLLRRLLGKTVELIIEAPPTGPVVVADVSQLEQVVMNLVVNARDAMGGNGKLVIRVGTEELDGSRCVPAGRYATLAVTDTGAGMSEDVRAQIFEPFFTTKGNEGTGLGLATVHGIVTQSGGHVCVASEPGKGTTFVVHLPCADSAA